MTRDIAPRELVEVLRARIGDRRLVLLLDYDGTLTAIVEHPQLAVLDNETRAVLGRVVRRWPVYVISGRERDDVKRRLGVDGVHYVGSHGFEMPEALPGIEQQTLDAAAASLKSAAGELERRLERIDGVLIERKKHSFALHYRMVDPVDGERVAAAARDVLARHPALTSKPGKKVIEFLPDFPWDKGRCVQALLSRLDGAHFAVYIGDDITDEDVFRVLDPAAGLGIVVAGAERDSAAEFRLPDPGAVREFLALLD